jgi:PAS domain S-box-containing protein
MSTNALAERMVQMGLLGEAIDAGPHLVFVADEEGRYLAVSQGACTLLGYTREELLGLRVTDVAAYPDAPGEYREMLDAGARRGRSELRRKDGGSIMFDYRAYTTTMAGMTVYIAVGAAD